MAPGQTPVHKYFYSMIEIGVVRIFIEQGIFQSIPADSNDGISVSELAVKTGAEPDLLARFVNFSVAAEVLTSPSPGRVAHTSRSMSFLRERAVLMFTHIFDFFMPAATQWPGYFATNGFREPRNANLTPYGYALGHPDHTLYEILANMPEKAADFNRAMALTLGDMPTKGVYDFAWVERYGLDTDTDRTLIVDVGGGKGQALKAILEDRPFIQPSRCVLQDRADVIQSVAAIGQEAGGDMLASVTKQAASLFAEQPVKGALVYHIRRVLNDWADEDCVSILIHIRRACAPDSRVIVAETLLPQKEPPSIDLASADIWMMNFGGKRRGGDVYAAIAKRAGLLVMNVVRDEKTDFAYIEMVPLEASAE